MRVRLFLGVCLVVARGFVRTAEQQGQTDTSVCSGLPGQIGMDKASCQFDFLMVLGKNHSRFLKLLPSHLQHNKDTNIRKRKLDIVVLDEQSQPACIFKGASTLTFRNEISEVLASAIVSGLNLPVVRAHSRGTLLPVQPESSEKQLLSKVVQTAPVLLDGTKSLLVPGVSMDFLHDAYAYATSDKLKQSIKKRFNADRELRRNVTHSYGAIRLLDALISNFDRTSKNCKVNKHGIWLAVDNDSGFHEGSVYQALAYKETLKCLATFIPKGTSTFVQCSALKHAQSIVQCAPPTFAREVERFLGADTLIQHFQLKSYPGKNETECFASFGVARKVLSYVGHLGSRVSAANQSMVVHSDGFCTINLAQALSAYVSIRMQESVAALAQALKRYSC